MLNVERLPQSLNYLGMLAGSAPPISGGMIRAGSSHWSREYPLPVGPPIQAEPSTLPNPQGIVASQGGMGQQEECELPLSPEVTAWAGDESLR